MKTIHATGDCGDHADRHESSCYDNEKASCIRVLRFDRGTQLNSGEC